MAAQIAGWTTPQAHDTNPRGAGNRQNKKGGAACLAWDAKMAGWPTPMSGTPAQKGYNEAGNTDSSRKTVDLMGWGTPRSTNAHNRTTTGVRAENPNGRLEDQASGANMTSYPVQTEKRGALNPAHSLWLMGFPTDWANCAPTEMPSSLKPRRNS
jgi:hypothetical protein